jgi:transcriptional regulator with XRE-family HTH domain
MTNRALENWLVEQKQAGRSAPRSDLAKKVECSTPRITQIAKYGQEPSLALAAKLSKVTGIPIDQFVKKPEVNP